MKQEAYEWSERLKILISAAAEIESIKTRPPIFHWQEGETIPELDIVKLDRLNTIIKLCGEIIKEAKDEAARITGNKSLYFLRETNGFPVLECYALPHATAYLVKGRKGYIMEKLTIRGNDDGYIYVEPWTEEEMDAAERHIKEYIKTLQLE